MHLKNRSTSDLIVRCSETSRKRHNIEELEQKTSFQACVFFKSSRFCLFEKIEYFEVVRPVKQDYDRKNTRICLRATTFCIHFLWFIIS